MTPPASAIVFGAPQYLDQLKRKKEVIARLCSALQEFLVQDIDGIIEQIQNPPKPPKMRRFTIEDLMEAQKEVDAMERQVEGLERMAKGMPPEMGEAFIETQKPGLERLMQPAKDRVAMIQRMIEESPEPDSPWDGSHQIGTMCANCARTFEQIATSPKLLGRLLTEAGWARDQEGDFLCPDCFRASTKPTPEPTALANPSAETETGTKL